MAREYKSPTKLVLENEMSQSNIKIGLYTEYDGRFRFTYRVRKVCKKTAVVTTGTAIDGDYDNAKYSTSYRYPLDLLRQEIANAEYTP